MTQVVLSVVCILMGDDIALQTVLQFALALGTICVAFDGGIWKKLLVFVAELVLASASSLGAAWINLQRGIMILDSFSKSSQAVLSALLSTDILMILVFVICWVILLSKREDRRLRFAKFEVALFPPLMLLHYVMLTIRYYESVSIDMSVLVMEYAFQCLLMSLLYVQYFAVRKNIDLLEENHTLSIQKAEQENQKKYYALARSKFDEISKLRHDFQNQMGTVYQLLIDKRSAQAQRIVQELQGALNEVKIVQYCEDPVINTVLTTKANDPLYRTIDMQFVMRSCDRLPLDEAEVCSLFANLFDNAAKAALESGHAPVLQMESGVVQGYYVLRVTNSARPDAVPTGIHTPSTKRSPGHGYGLAIVANIAEKHGGAFTLEQQDDQFVVGVVTIPISPSAN